MSIVHVKDAERMPAPRLGMFKRLQMATKLALGRYDEPLSGMAADMLNGITSRVGGEPPKRHTHDFLMAYSTMPWVRAISHRVSTDVATTTWRLYVPESAAGKFVRRDQMARMGQRERKKVFKALRATGDLREIERHPLLDLLAFGNPLFTGTQVDKLVQIHMDLVGEAFCVFERNGAGMPIEVWPIPPSWITETPTPSRPRYRIDFRGWTGNIPDSEVLWMVDADPANPFGRGSGIARALSDELSADEYAAKTISAAFYNRARPDFLLVAKGAQKNQLDRFKDEWLSDHQGFFRQAKPHFVNWDIEIKEFSRNFRELQLSELRKQERDIIMQTWGIPPEMLGVIENSNRSTIDAADYLYARHVLLPRLEHRRGYLQERLVPEFDDRLIIDYDSPVDDREGQEKARTTAPWAVLLDEHRMAMGLEPLDNDMGKVFMVPLNLRAMRPEDLAGEAEADAGARVVTDDEDDEDVAALDEGQKRKHLPAGRSLQRVKNPALIRVMDRIAQRMEGRMRTAFLRAVEETRGAVDRAALEVAVQTGKVDDVMHALGLDEFAGAMQAQDIRAIGAALVEQAGGHAAAMLASMFGVEFAFDLTNAHTVAFIDGYDLSLIQALEPAQREAIRNLLRESATLGIEPKKLARMIEPHIGLTEQQSASLWTQHMEWLDAGLGDAEAVRRAEGLAARYLRQRATTIARTETMRAANEGQQLAWDQAVKDGVLKRSDMRKVFIVTPDELLCPICEPMPGMEENADVDYDGAFVTGDGNHIAVPPVHPKCRCTVGLEPREKT